MAGQRPKLRTGLDNFLRARLWSFAPPNLPPQEMSPRTFQKGGIIPEKTVIIEKKTLKERKTWRERKKRYQFRLREECSPLEQCRRYFNLKSFAVQKAGSLN